MLISNHSKLRILSISFRKSTERYQWPNSAHGLVEITTLITKSALWRIGTLIGFNLVLTTISKIYNCKDYSSVRFHLSIEDDKSPFPGVIDIVKFYYSESKTHNYALLVLEHPIGLWTGYFGLYAEKLAKEYRRFNDKEVTATIFQGNESAVTS